MFDKLRSFVANLRPSMDAATQLPPQPLPKGKRGGLAFPSFLRSTKPDRSALPRDDRRLANTDILSFRNDPDTYKLIRQYVAASPDLSNALSAYLRVGIPTGFSAIARNMDGTVNPEATKLVQQIIARMDFLAPEKGYSGGTSVHTIAESLGREIVMYGSCAAELVLDKAMTPARIQPISVTQIEYWPSGDGKSVEPFQKIGQDTISLNLPTVAIVQHDQDLLATYSESMLQAAIKPVQFSEELAADLHKVIKKAIHPRVKAVVSEEAFRKFGLSSEAQVNPDLAAEEFNALISDLENKLSNLAVDDALVHTDAMTVTTENSASTGLSNEYEALTAIADARLAAGAKTMPAVLGKGGNQNTARTETMLFVKAAEGTIKVKLDEVFSRLYTTAIRLMGVDGYVSFTFDEISLRPREELLAFTQTKLSINSDLLSMGVITDEEFAIRMTGELPPAGAPKLSGTMFRHQGNQTSQDQITSTQLYGGASNDGSTLNKNLKPDTPAQGRGGNKK